jgi:hypothetical protein
MIPVKTPDGEKLRPLYRELFQATPEHMKASFQLRRRGMVRDAVQLDLDYKSYLDNNVHGATLPPMDYNLNPDVEELNLPTTYPDPDEDDDEIN